MTWTCARFLRGWCHNVLMEVFAVCCYDFSFSYKIRIYFKKNGFEKIFFCLMFYERIILMFAPRIMAK